MRKALLIITAAAAAAGAWGAFGTVLQSFPAPAANPVALAYRNGFLWCYCQSGRYDFYRINPANGNVLSTFISPASVSTRGATSLLGYLFTGHLASDYIFRMSAAGSVYSSFHVNNFYGGLAADAVYLWYTGPAPRYFYRMTTAGSVVSSFPAAFYPYDPGCDGTYLYCGSSDPGQRIYKLTLTGSVVKSVAPPANFAWGCTHDGKDLWVSTTTGSNYIWRLDDGEGQDVAPATLGRVKVLFK